jgi:SPP1 gp7 family putative phage head morphogenesis protein
MRRQLEPRAIQLAYFAALRKVLASAKARVTRTLLPVLPELTARAAERRGDSKNWVEGQIAGQKMRLFVAVHDAMDPGKRLNRMFDRMSESFYKEWDPSRLTAIAKQYGEAASTFQKEELRKQLSARLGIDPLIAEPGLRQRIKDFTAENVALIKSIPQQYFDQVEQRVINGVRTGARHGELAKQVEERFDVAESRAKLIARDQTLKFYGELNAARQQAMGVEKYVWRTSNDQRVRDAHAEFDGNTYSWDDPPGDGSPQEGTHPGTGINCRCTADPVLDDLFEAAGVPADPVDPADE